MPGFGAVYKLLGSAGPFVIMILGPTGKDDYWSFITLSSTGFGGYEVGREGHVGAWGLVDPSVWALLES